VRGNDTIVAAKAPTSFGWTGGNDVFVFAAGSDHQLLAAIGYAGTDAVADHWLNRVWTGR
jgi:hypothetical protein